MSNVEKVNEMMKNNPDLAGQLAEEAHRLSESGEKDVRKISFEAVKKVFGVDLTGEELDQVEKDAKTTELTPEMLEAVSGGGWKSAIVNAVGSAMGGVGIGAPIGGIIGCVIPIAGAPIGMAVGGAVGFVAGAIAGGIEGALMDEPN